MATLGVRPTGALALVVSAAAFAALLVRTGVPRPLLGSLVGVLTITGNLVSGRVTYALGVAFGLAALLALTLPAATTGPVAARTGRDDTDGEPTATVDPAAAPTDRGATATRPAAPGRAGAPRDGRGGPTGGRWARPVLVVAGAVLASATSPVAGLFVGLVGVALLVTRRWADGLLLGVAAAVPLAVTGLLFGEGGWMNISRTDTLRSVTVSLLVAGLVAYRPVRVGALLAAGGVLAAALVHTPVGLNATRLVTMFALPVLAAAARPPGWLTARLPSAFRPPAPAKAGGSGAGKVMETGAMARHDSVTRSGGAAQDGAGTETGGAARAGSSPETGGAARDSSSPETGGAARDSSGAETSGVGRAGSGLEIGGAARAGSGLETGGVGRTGSVGWIGRAVLAGLLALVCWWLPPVVAADLRSADDPTADRGYFDPLAAELGRRGLTGRVEVPPTRNYWEAAQLGEVPLARGWLRQVDIGRNPLFFTTVPGATGTGVPLTVDTYRAWLDEYAVQYVAVPDAPLSWVGRAEAELVGAGLPYLTEVWSDRHWRLYAVTDPTPLVAAPGELVRHDGATLTFRTTAPGRIRIRIRHSPWLTASAPATITADGPWTLVTVPTPGTWTLH
ncbi:hypothetical protein ABZ436_14480 [Micromonospora matsumotoense]